MNRWIAYGLPVAIVAVAGAVAAVIMAARTPPERVEPAEPVPLVRAATVETSDVQLVVESQGTVEPRTETRLVAEVAGRIIEVVPDFEDGAFFERDDLLVRIDPHDYRQALVRAEADVARAELRLAQEEAEAEIAREEWQELGGEKPTPLTLREPQVAEARAALEAARAAVEQARRNLERTEIRAPYRGRIRGTMVDVGQYVGPGAPIADVYAVDYAEIRLPLPDRELAFIDLPLGYRDVESSSSGPEVRLRADFAGQTYEWTGRIVRTDGQIDRRSRMVTAVARVADPYGRGADPDRPPLAAGLYVRAEILGRQADDVAVIPRAAVRPDGRVLVIGDDDRLEFRDIEVLRLTSEQAIVRSGLAPGERVVLTALAVATDGMKVRTEDETERDGEGAG